jgi:hypothetical protein
MKRSKIEYSNDTFSPKRMARTPEKTVDSGKKASSLPLSDERKKAAKGSANEKRGRDVEVKVGYASFFTFLLFSFSFFFPLFVFLVKKRVC